MVPGVVLVGLKPNVTMSRSATGIQSSNATLNARLARVGARSVERLFPFVRTARAVPAVGRDVDLTRLYRLRLAPNADIARVVEELRSDSSVAYAEPDYLARIIATPNDPEFANQWGLSKIDAPSAWNTTTGSSDVVIAVVDSGIDSSHPDLAGQLWTNPGEITGNGIDDDNNGYVDDVSGWNIFGNNADLSDTTGHGTQVAGVIAAATNNNTGVAGVCWNCRLMIVKVMQIGGIANYSDIAAGVLYAAQKGAKIINLSLGGNSDSATLKAAIASASSTAVIIGGTGNDNSSAAFYPAAYDDFVLAVAGTTQTDTKVGTSNFGTWVDVSAPGEIITTTFSGGGYGSASGTSMSAPFAAGLAALLRSQFPGWPANEIRGQIIQTTDNIDSINPTYVGKLGSGRINAQKAMVTTPSPLIRFVDYAGNGQINGSLKVGTTVPLAITLRNDWKNVASINATLSTSSTDVSITKASASWGAIASGQSVANNSDSFQVTVPAGKYSLAIPFALNIVADGVNSTFAFTATTESQAVNVGGILTSNTMWTNDRVYIATSNVIVRSDITLTIQPGTVVKFNPGVLLNVRGSLVADGTLSQPIRFTSNAANPAPGDWGGPCYGGYGGSICFDVGARTASYDTNDNYQSGPIIRNAIIEYGKGINLDGSVPFISQNLIWKNSGEFIIYKGASGPNSRLVITRNRFLSNRGRFDLSNSFIMSQNLIANNSSDGQLIFGAYPVYSNPNNIISNTITGNSTNNYPGSNACGVDTILCPFQYHDTPIGLTSNNILGNHSSSDVAVYTDPHGSISVAGNFWGTTDPSAVSSRIYDAYGWLTWTPFLAQPEPTAPAFLYQLSLNPSSPVGIQQVTFNLSFSAPMDQSINPVVTFGATSPYTTYATIDNAQWLSSTQWRATYDITSLVPRGTYTISVSGAKGVDGMDILTDTRFGFIVDYAGQITDQTPPNTPTISATGKTGDASFVQANWSAVDPDSSIIGYRYAIGTAPGSTDIVNWTATTATSISRSGFGLISGRQYWIAVQARNVGGLWSGSGNRSFIAGQQSLWQIYLPSILK